MADALRLALTTFTVLPVRAGRIDRRAAAGSIALAPAVGLLLGATLALVTAGLTAVGCAPLLTAALGLGGLALATRGLHLDGLADTADGLGCRGDRDRTLAVMASPEVGPFGVVSLVLVLLVQASALAGLVAGGRWLAIAVGVAAGRLAIVWGCRRGVPAARPGGLGALVAGTQPVGLAVAWTIGLGLLGWWAGGWLGPLGVLAAVLVTAGALAHLTRRIGGVTGDVLGAICEVSTMVSWTVLVVTP
ncbi:MAG: adenosylcobinamide-GDP ribazoletransferase [Actinobacteria bacterium]|nr:adenosylcobinamide-GDP ribazoletransferase [Actinomycetota bacterium]